MVAERLSSTQIYAKNYFKNNGGEELQVATSQGLQRKAGRLGHLQLQVQVLHGDEEPRLREPFPGGRDG